MYNWSVLLLNFQPNREVNMENLAFWGSYENWESVDFHFRLSSGFMFQASVGGTLVFAAWLDTTDLGVQIKEEQNTQRSDFLIGYKVFVSELGSGSLSQFTEESLFVFFVRWHSDRRVFCCLLLCMPYVWVIFLDFTYIIVHVPITLIWWNTPKFSSYLTVFSDFCESKSR